MPLTPKEGKRLHVVTILDAGKISTTQAAEALGASRRQLFRLRAKLQAAGGKRALKAGHQLD